MAAPQLFPPWATTALRSALLGIPALGVLASAAWGVAYQASYYTDVDEPLEQPVPFSHQHHVAGLGISEISKVTGRPEGTVKADIHRGLSRLKETMEREHEH